MPVGDRVGSKAGKPLLPTLKVYPFGEASLLLFLFFLLLFLFFLLLLLLLSLLLLLWLLLLLLWLLFSELLLLLLLLLLLALELELERPIGPSVYSTLEWPTGPPGCRPSHNYGHIEHYIISIYIFKIN